MMKNKISTFIILLTLFYVAVNAQAPISTAVLGGTGTEIINDYFRDAAGNQYITGSFEGIVDFDQTTGTYNLTSLNSGQDLFIAKYSSGNVLKFAKSIGGLYNDEGTGIAVDTKGNILVSGYFMDIVDFDPGAGVVNLNSQINPDAFLLKLDTAGNFVYVKQTQGTGEVLTKGVQLDLDGNAYLAGRFNGPCNFDPGATNFTLNGSVAGDPAIFFAKYDSSGILKFAKEINGSGLDILNDFYIDNNKEIYLTGYFQNSTDFDPTLSTSNLNALGGQDAFFAKYSSTGNLVFAKQLSGAFSEEGYSITTDASNNIIVAGSFTGTVDFDPGTGSNPITASSSFSIFLSKFDSNGNLIFANGFGEGRPKALACDQYSNI